MDAGLATRSVCHPAAPVTTFSGRALFSVWDRALVPSLCAGCWSLHERHYPQDWDV